MSQTFFLCKLFTQIDWKNILNKNWIFRLSAMNNLFRMPTWVGGLRTTGICSGWMCLDWICFVLAQANAFLRRESRMMKLCQQFAMCCLCSQFSDICLSEHPFYSAATLHARLKNLTLWTQPYAENLRYARTTSSQGYGCIWEGTPCSTGFHLSGIRSQKINAVSVS